MVRLEIIHRQLIRIAQSWAWKKDYDAVLAKKLREEACLINHARYIKHIPVYRNLVKEEGIGKISDLEPIKNRLMLTDDIFKSYDQTYLDNADFSRMNKWLGTIFHENITVDVSDVRSIDEWINRLASNGIYLAYSSGTTGRFSFVPRCTRSWKLFTTAPINYIAPIMVDLGISGLFQNRMLKLAMKLRDPFSLADIARKIGMPGCDGIFLSFRRGNMGIQMVAQEFSKMFGNASFLYDMDISASALRLIGRGVRSDEDRKILDQFTAETVGKKQENYLRIIRQIKHSAGKHRKVFLFGAPYQIMELVKMIKEKEGAIPLKKGSFILTGGGWKSFEGEKIEREFLVRMIRDVFEVDDEFITDGYSMTEVNSLLCRCVHGRYHLPPIIEPVILNNEFIPLEGSEQYGRFGFLDPFAISYPGFIISGDNVRFHDDRCACGMYGPSLSEPGRAPGREIKGCGGIMASVQA
jgi:hypothetical protein